MTNNTSKPRSKRFDELVISADNGDNPHFKRVLDRQCAALLQFFRNNQYLLSLANVSVYTQCKVLTEAFKGYRLKRQTYFGMKHGKRRTCDTFWLNAIASFWGYQWYDLVSKDLESVGYSVGELPSDCLFNEMKEHGYLRKVGNSLKFILD